MGEDGIGFRVATSRPEGKRLEGRPRRGWVDYNSDICGFEMAHKWLEWLR